MRPALIETIGYLVSCVSVALLGAAAFPGAEKAGLEPALIACMATSIAVMGLRRFSYETENCRSKASAGETRARNDLAHEELFVWQAIV